MLDLQRYGIADKWPKLRKLQEEVSSLERRRLEAERAAMAARQGVEAAKQQDNEHAAKALRAGKDMPAATRQAKAEAQLEAAERTLTAFGKALEGAQSDLYAYSSQHSSEIHAALTGALAVKAERLAELAREATALYAMIEDSRYDLKRFVPPPPPPDENAPAAKNSTEVIALRTSASAAPARGHVEETLRYLAALRSQFAAPREPSGEAKGNAA